jgi:hypothetical protein
MRSLLTFLTVLTLHAQVLGVGARKIFPAVTGTPPTYVSSCQNNNTTTTSVACTITGVAAGDLIPVALFYTPSSAVLSSITNSCGGSTALVDAATTTTNVGATTGAYFYNVTGGSCTITATFTSSPTKGILAHDVAGALASGSPLDQHTVGRTAFANTTCTNCLSSGSVTTTQNNEYVFAACMDTTVAAHLTAGTGYTVRQSQTAYGLTEDRTLLAAGSIAATCNRSSSSTANTNVIIITFKSATPS